MDLSREPKAWDGMSREQLTAIRETVHTSVRQLEDAKSTRALSTNEDRALTKYIEQRDAIDEALKWTDPDVIAAVQERAALIADVEKSGRVIRSFGPGGRTYADDQNAAPGALRAYGVGDDIRSFRRPTGEPSLGAVVRGMALGDWSHMTAEQRALVSTGAAAAIPGASVLAIQEQAMQESVIFQAGAQIVPIERPSEKVARVISTGTAEWLPDTPDRELSDQAIEVSPVDLTAHSAWLYTSLSIETLEDAVGLDQAIEAAFAKQLAVLYDQAGFAGNGINMPTGIGYMSNAADGILEIPAVGLLEDHTPFIRAAGAVLGAHHKPTSVTIDPDTWTKLAMLADTTGQPIQPPKAYTDLGEHVSDFLVPGDAIVADWSKFLFGYRTGITLEVNRTGAGFRKGFVEVRAYIRFGGIPVDPTAFCRLSGIELEAAVS
ncbi:MAG: phage major capsid protein [Actinomycetota bacterium]